MVKDIPIPKEILLEFQPFVKDKESLKKLFDSLNCCALCDGQGKVEDMPSQTKGQISIDKYFAKVNSQKNSSNCIGEMGKKTNNSNSLHDISSSSESETKEPALKSIKEKSLMAVDVDSNSNEAIEFERSPSKPIVAAIDALGKLKQGIAKVTVEDNSSRDSTALIIDEEQLEPEKDKSPDLEDTAVSKSSSKKSPQKSSSNKHEKPAVENVSLNFSNFFNISKSEPFSQENNKFSTSTPVELAKNSKRKRTDIDRLDEPNVKRSKDKNSRAEKESWLQSKQENMEEDMMEIKNLKDGDCPMFLEDLESDDELFVVQCPKEVDLKDLVGKSLELNSESALKLEVKGINGTYEYFSEKDSMGRHVNMVLPSRKEGIFKFGVYQLNGSIVISETMDDTDDVKSSDSEIPLNKVSLNAVKELHSPEHRDSKEGSIETIKKHKKKRDISDPEKTCTENMKNPTKEGEEVEGQENNSLHSMKKKKKKKEKPEDKVTDPEQTSHSDADFEKVKKKKKEKKEELLINPEENTLVQEEKKIKKKKKEKVNVENEKPADVEPKKMDVDEDIPLKKKKKKKKHHDEVENIEPEIELQQLPLVAVKEEALVAPSEESISDLPIKRKKKKKDKERVAESDLISIQPIAEPVLSDEQIIKKKKKKKYHDQEPDFNDFQVDQKPPVQEENTQRFDEGDSLNHLKLSTFVETDTLHIKKKKKKKKKKEREKEFD